LKGIFPGWM